MFETMELEKARLEREKITAQATEVASRFGIGMYDMWQLDDCEHRLSWIAKGQLGEKVLDHDKHSSFARATRLASVKGHYSGVAEIASYNDGVLVATTEMTKLPTKHGRVQWNYEVTFVS